MSIRLRVRELAERNGIDDAAKLSRAAGIAYATARRIWNNDLGSVEDGKGPGIFILAKIARALGLRVVDLIDEES